MKTVSAYLPLCRVEGCQEFMHPGTPTFCENHRRLIEAGTRISEPIHASRYLDRDGYVRIGIGGFRRGYTMEHRLVLERTLGRDLGQGESAHHKNGVRHDNRAENLELWVVAQPPGQRASDLICPHCGKTYGDPPRP